MRYLRLLLCLILLPAALTSQQQGPGGQRPDRFDLGRMWTFEYPPAEYFSSTYGFSADSAWFTRARMAALRIPGCSAAFVSASGLIVTNHHCVRGSVNAMSRSGESLLDSGFVAAGLADERRIPNMIADQLLAAVDISKEVDAAGDAAAAGPNAGRGPACRDHGGARSAQDPVCERRGFHRGTGRPAVQRCAHLGIHLPALYRHPPGGRRRTRHGQHRRRLGQLHLSALRARLRLDAGVRGRR